MWRELLRSDNTTSSMRFVFLFVSVFVILTVVGAWAIAAVKLAWVSTGPFVFIDLPVNIKDLVWEVLGVMALGKVGQSYVEGKPNGSVAPKS